LCSIQPQKFLHLKIRVRPSPQAIGSVEMVQTNNQTKVFHPNEYQDHEGAYLCSGFNEKDMKQVAEWER
jgi:hypothetical protein